MGPYSFGHLQTSEERHRAQLPQQAVWINSADDKGHYWGAVGLYKILRKSGTLIEWICTDLDRINQLSSKAIRFFWAQVVLFNGRKYLKSSVLGWMRTQHMMWKFLKKSLMNVLMKKNIRTFFDITYHRSSKTLKSLWPSVSPWNYLPFENIWNIISSLSTFFTNAKRHSIYL